MDLFAGWWGLDPLSRWLFGAAIFFSVFFLWQFVMAMIGLVGGEVVVDTSVDPVSEHHSPDDAADTVAVFKLLSVHSVLAFLTLFSWAGALYINARYSVALALGLAFLWGIAALLIVSWLLYAMRRLAASGNMRLESCVGTEGTVHLDIPANGNGEVRILCGTATTHLKARAAGGVPIKAGTPVRVTRVIGLNTIEVEAVK